MIVIHILMLIGIVIFSYAFFYFQYKHFNFNDDYALGALKEAEGIRQQ